MRRALVAGTLCLLLSACGSGPATTPTPMPASPLTVAAASDVQRAFAEIGPLFEQSTHSTVVFAYAASAVLATQIEQGAPYDLFVSADASYVDQLASKRLVLTDTVTAYAQGRIVMAVPASSALTITQISDLTRGDVRSVAIANPDHAPYGRAAREALQTAGLWDGLRPKLVYGENIGATAQFVETGNADVGIIALSFVSPRVRAVPVPASLYHPLQQTLAVVRGSKNEQMARAFASFIISGEGRAVMERYGYRLPGEP